MKPYFLIMLACLFVFTGHAQKIIKDESVIYQQERMVFKQWDKNKFKPGSGWTGLNPYYWLTWGLMPSYKKKDLRPLSPAGPQTQRLGLVGVMNNTDDDYKLHSDTIGTTALLEVANQSGLVSGADPLWFLYYSKELRPATDYTSASILNPLPPPVRAKVVSEGLYDWYVKELDMLAERIAGARSANMDRGARILAYHRLLKEFRVLQASWTTRTANGVSTIEMTKQQQKVKSGAVEIPGWTPRNDEDIAKKILADRKY